VPGIRTARQNQKDFIIRNSLLDIQYSFVQVKQVRGVENPKGFLTAVHSLL
jgi:hypothetical protein